MVAALWRRCKHPLRAALIGKEMCGRIRRVRPHNLATREAREQLQSVEEICSQSTLGILDNVRSQQSARQVLLDQYDELGMQSGKRVNLMELGINTIDDEMVVRGIAAQTRACL